MGAVQTVAIVTPVGMADMARANSDAGISRVASNADSTLVSSSGNVKAIMTIRWSMRRVSSGGSGGVD